MKTSLLILLVILMIPISESFAEEIEIKFGETISYENLKFYFYDIEDSRCPSDVTCIWEGEVWAMIRYSNATLDVGGQRNIGHVDKLFEPYTILLKGIEPYPISTEKPEYVAILEITKPSMSDELIDEQVCGVGNVLINGICQPSEPKPSDFRDLQRGETISNPEVAIIIQSLGAILIVFFIILYAIKKRLKKKENQ
ncbi:MAG: hypothetical protein ACW9W3_06850 [Candidatus Nitrosopumilus sp. bin_68KS]